MCFSVNCHHHKIKDIGGIVKDGGKNNILYLNLSAIV